MFSKIHRFSIKNPSFSEETSLGKQAVAGIACVGFTKIHAQNRHKHADHLRQN